MNTKKKTTNLVAQNFGSAELAIFKNETLATLLGRV
jgi:hypothetical protein